MLTILDLHSAKAVGMIIDGKIETDEFNELLRGIEEKIEKEDRIGIYVECPSFKGMTFEALKQDLKFGMKKSKRISEKALVANAKWMESDCSNTRFGSATGFSRALRCDTLLLMKKSLQRSG